MRRGGGRIRIVNPPLSRALLANLFMCAFIPTPVDIKKKLLEIFGFVWSLKIHELNAKTTSVPFVKLDNYFRAF